MEGSYESFFSILALAWKKNVLPDRRASLVPPWRGQGQGTGKRGASAGMECLW